MSNKCGNLCSNKNFDGASQNYKRVLWLIVAINGLMFFVEVTAGFFADSTALKADSLDFLGDTATYALTLLVIGKTLKTRARVAFLKGISLGVMALLILGFTIYRAIYVGQLQPFVMSTIGILALMANLTSVILLMKYREGDSNVESVWLCSRNDAIGNVAVILAGIFVFITGTIWPDIIVAFVIAGLFLHSSIKISMKALSEIKECSS